MELTISERRRLREQGIESKSIDAGEKCQCTNCGDLHFRKKEAKPEAKETGEVESDERRLGIQR